MAIGEYMKYFNNYFISKKDLDALLDAFDENYKTWWDKDELERRYDILNELVGYGRDLNLSDYDIKRASRILNNVIDQLKGAFEEPRKDIWGIVNGTGKSDIPDENPTGIANPADYMSKVTFEKDTDGDGDIDTKVIKTTEDKDTY